MPFPRSNLPSVRENSNKSKTNREEIVEEKRATNREVEAKTTWTRRDLQVISIPIEGNEFLNETTGFFCWVDFSFLDFLAESSTRCNRVC